MAHWLVLLAALLLASCSGQPGNCNNNISGSGNVGNCGGSGDDSDVTVQTPTPVVVPPVVAVPPGSTIE